VQLCWSEKLSEVVIARLRIGLSGSRGVSIRSAGCGEFASWFSVQCTWVSRWENRKKDSQKLGNWRVIGLIGEQLEDLLSSIAATHDA
jgi:hypothetical protein